MSDIRVKTDDGKYEFICKDDCLIHVLRNGEPWLIISQGYKAIFDLMNDLLMARDKIDSIIMTNNRWRDALIKQSDQIEQILGKALGYPWYKGDQKNFPGATEADGVCVGEHVPLTIADEAANKIKQQAEQISYDKSQMESHSRTIIELKSQIESLSQTIIELMQ